MNRSEISDIVLQEKYCKGTETTVEDVIKRVAKGLSNNNTDYDAFEASMLNGFIPGGRICSSAGTDLNATLINCFVQPVGDAISGDAGANHVLDKIGIYDALKQAAETMRRGGGVGYNFGHVRPYGAHVVATGSHASGPISYMRVFDKSCETVAAAGSRRGAQMGVLPVHHPDIEAFVTSKSKGDLSNFNISVGVTNLFMDAVINDTEFALFHKAKPMEELYPNAIYIEAHNVWEYKRISARELWNTIMETTYNGAEPGILFMDRINETNNLKYCETIEATNPCGEQPLPNYGCCDLGSINLTKFVQKPFTEFAYFETDKFVRTVYVAIRLLDNVLDKTIWPLEEQKVEAMNKRRIGLGFTGLGNMLAMLCIPYNSEQARRTASDISKVMSETAYKASIDLARERGAFPLFDADKYLKTGSFASTLPDEIQEHIRKYGIRNSHLISIAPTGTISLAFGDNVSNGIEPPFSYTYQRKKREKDGTHKIYDVSDYAYRLYNELFPNTELPKYFTTALELPVSAHVKMMEAVAPYIDSAISKTVNVPEDYPFEDFKNIYMDAYKAGLKGITTYRPNSITGAVLSVKGDKDVKPKELQHNVRLSLKNPEVCDLSHHLSSPHRPKFSGGNPSWSYMVESATGEDFSVSIGYYPTENTIFECWVLGNYPKGLDAVARTISIDIRTQDIKWIDYKLNALAKIQSSGAYKTQVDENTVLSATDPSSMLAKIIRHVLETCTHPTLDNSLVTQLVSKREPRIPPEGTLSWSVRVDNPQTHDNFNVFVQEGLLQDKVLPFSVYITGDNVPDAVKGLSRSLSIDMRIGDPTWVTTKLQKLSNHCEAGSDFFATIPGEEKSKSYGSTIAYLSTLLLYRYSQLGVESKEIKKASLRPCPECGHNLSFVDGCKKCLECGYIGSCG